MLPDGTLLMAPYSSSVIGRYDPYTDSYYEVSGVPNATASGKYSGAATLENGKIVMCPYNATNVLVASLSGDYKTEYVTSRFWASA